jgi:hypothetical protein
MGYSNAAAGLAALVLCTALAGCLRKGEPSADYREGRARFTELYGRELEDAYLHPEMAEVEAQLEAVPKESSDSQRAEELLRRIRSGRERVSSLRQEREEELAAALAPTIDPGATAEPSAPPEPPAQDEAAEPDAGAPEPVDGMSVEELIARFSACFAAGEQVLVEGEGLRPTWALRPTAPCQARFARLQDKLLIADEGGVLLIVERSRLEIQPADGGVGR